jgi:hypothetical protein
MAARARGAIARERSGITLVPALMRIMTNRKPLDALATGLACVWSGPGDEQRMSVDIALIATALSRAPLRGETGRSASGGIPGHF